MRLDDNHLDSDRCAQQVNHLLVGERSDSHLTDLHQSAALPQPRFPGEAKGLDVGHDALKVDMETELAQAIPAQSHLRRLATSGGDLESKVTVITKCSKDHCCLHFTDPGRYKQFST